MRCEVELGGCVVFIVQCFQLPNYFRVVLTVPEDKLREASRRIAEFCSRHYSAPASNGHI